MKGLTLGLNEDEIAVIDLREFGLGLIQIMNVESRPGRARLLFDADRRIRIDRKEIFDSKERTRAGATA